MAKVFTCVAGLAIGVLLAFWAARPAQVDGSAAPGSARPTPEIDARAARARQPAVAADARHSSPSIPAAPTAATAFGTARQDVTYTAIEFGLEHLDRLLGSGRVTVEDPEGGELELVLVGARHSGHLQTLTVTSDGLPGVITRGADHFYATLPTHRAVYTIEFRNGESRWIDQRQLDNRVIPGLADYRRAPVG